MKRTIICRVLTTLALSLFIMGCSLFPSESDDTNVSGPSAGANSVLGSISGVVKTNNLQPTLLDGVTVSIAKVNGTSINSVNTNASGLYAFEDLIPGDYVLTYRKDGYESVVTRVFVTSDQYKSDDPLNQIETFTKTLDALALTVGTYTAISGDGDAATVPVLDTAAFVESLDLMSSLDEGYSFAVAMVDVPMAPLTASVSGEIDIALAKANNYVGTTSIQNGKEGITVVLTQAAEAVEAPTSATAARGDFLPSSSYLEQNNYQYTGVTDENGEFLIENLPANKTFVISLLTFDQTINDIKYYFNDTTSSFTGETVDTLDGIKSTFKNVIEVSPIDAAPTIIGHNIGITNFANPLTIDPSLSTSAIVITFSKSMQPNSYYANVNDSASIDIDLTGTWSSDNTVLTLLPKDDLGDDNDGVLPHNLVGSATLYLNVVSADGFLLSYGNDLGIYTIKSISSTTQYFTTSANVETTNLPLDGKYVAKFNKNLSALDTQTIELTENVSGNVITIPDSSITISSNVLTIDFDNVNIVAGTVYDLDITAMSTDYKDTVTIGTVTFTPTDSIELLSTNLYSGDDNIYYNEDSINSATPQFNIGSALTFTFNTALPTTTTKAALYKQSEINGFTSITDLDRHDMVLLGDATVGTSGAVLTITPTSALEVGTAYVVAIKITNASGYDLLNSKTSQFATDFSSVVAMEQGDGVVATKYIQFTTQEALAIVENSVDNHSVSNILDESDYSAAPTTDFSGNDNIILEFNRNITDNGSKLYFWDDSKGSTADVVEESELTETTATITASGNVLTINPLYELAPGKSFAIYLELQGDDVIDTLITEDLDTYKVFSVDNSAPLKYSADAYNIGTLNIGDNLSPHGTATGYEGYDSTDSNVNFTWDSMETILGEANLYTLNRKYYDGDWTATATTATEYTFLQSLIESEHETGDVNVLDGTKFYNSNTTQYFVSAWTNEGFIAQTTVESISDTIPPTVSTPAAALVAGTGDTTLTSTVVFSEPVILDNTSLTASFTNGTNPGSITYSIDYSDGTYTSVDVTIVIPATSTIETGDYYELDVTDLSGNELDNNLNTTAIDKYRLTI